MYLDLISVVVEAEQQEEVIRVYSASDEVEDERHLSEEFQREELKGKETSEEKKYIQEKIDAPCRTVFAGTGGGSDSG